MLRVPLVLAVVSLISLSGGGPPLGREAVMQCSAPCCSYPICPALFVLFLPYNSPQLRGARKTHIVLGSKVILITLTAAS